MLPGHMVIKHEGKHGKAQTSLNRGRRLGPRCCEVRGSAESRPPGLDRPASITLDFQDLCVRAHPQCLVQPTSQDCPRHQQRGAVLQDTPAPEQGLSLPPGPNSGVLTKIRLRQTQPPPGHQGPRHSSTSNSDLASRLCPPRGTRLGQATMVFDVALTCLQDKVSLGRKGKPGSLCHTQEWHGFPAT